MRMRRSHPSWIGKIEPFWRRMAKRGIKVATFDVPFTYRGETGGAVEISNWGSHDVVEEFWCSDPTIMNVVTSVAPRHPMGLEIPVKKTREKLLEAQRRIDRGIELKTEISRRLIENLEPELFIVVFGEPHRAGHLLWPEHDVNGSQVPEGALLNVYRAIDKAVGTLADVIAPESDIVLFALHGMGPNQSQSHLSREMLQIALTGRSASRADKGGLVRMLRRSVPDAIQHSIATLVPAAVRDLVFAREIGGGVDWAQTPAFSLEGDLSGYWRLNVKGREARGVVEDGEAEANRIATAFREFVTPEGEPICEAIHFPARFGSGERAFLLPDILVEWTSSLAMLDAALYSTGVRATGSRATGRSGNHRFKGFFCTRESGPPISFVPSHIGELGRLADELLLRSRASKI